MQIGVLLRWALQSPAGDSHHDEVAQAIARKVGIRNVRARLLPQDKVNVVTELRSRHKIVAMLGDGVNDAPALPPRV